MLEFRKAELGDIKALSILYDEVNDYLENNINYPGWKKGVYPTEKDAELAFNSDSLFVAVDDGDIVGSVVLNNEADPHYYNVKWKNELDYDEIIVVHTFVVGVNGQNKGVGFKILQWIEEYARELNMKALRLDTYEKNAPAIGLYKKYGYEYVDTISLGYEEFGLDWFNVYEYTL